jgi:sec-independent protein translocase protein TatC
MTGKVIATPFIFLFKVILFPFKVVWAVISFPFKLAKRFNKFLNTSPEEHALGEVVTSIINDSDMRSFIMHEIELFRMHLLRSILVLAATVIVMFWYAEPVMRYLATPVGGLENLQAIEVTEEIGVFMRVALMCGILIAFPYIALELWWFAAPGLHPREKKLGLLGIPVSTVLFLSGAGFTYFVMLPAALPILGSFTEISQFWSAREYFNFVTGLMLWIGLFFEFPLVIYILTALGFVQPRILLEQWRLAVVIIAVIAAAVTPTVDPVNMGLVMLPMIMLYFLSIGLSYIAYAGRRKNQMQKETAEAAGK